MKKKYIKNLISILSLICFTYISCDMILAKSDNFITYIKDRFLSKNLENDKTELLTSQVAPIISTYSEIVEQKFDDTYNINLDDNYEYKSLYDSKGFRLPDVSEEIIPIEHKFVYAPNGYFDDALFIGDSRMQGLKLYAPIDNATYLSKQSLDVYNIGSELIELDINNKVFYNNLITEKSFSKIYIMLGINNLGTDQHKHLKKYKEFLETLRKCQPNAIIYIMANLHVSVARSSYDKNINNRRIDEFNNMIKTLKDNKNVFYLDANFLYDDERKGLNQDMTSDGTHLYAKYYEIWKKFLIRNVVVK